MRIAISVLGLLLTGDILCAAINHTDAPSRRESLNALRDLTRQLTSEAQEAQSSGYLRHTTPSAAGRFGARVAEAELQTAITERQHRDPFIDAYIRWQLTSNEVDFPEMTAQQFARFMETAPPMVENPRGAPQAVAIFERANDAGPLAPSDLAHLRELNRELDRVTQRAESMNLPASSFRDWVAGKLGEDGPRRMLWMLENCAAIANAAGAPANTKRQISQALSASVNDPAVSDDDRRVVAQQIQRMAGIERRFINTVTILADGSVRVTFSTAAITTRDVNNWIARLAGE